MSLMLNKCEFDHIAHDIYAHQMNKRGAGCSLQLHGASLSSSLSSA